MFLRTDGRRWRRAIRVLLLGCVAGAAAVPASQAQEVTLRGFVTERAEGRPLQGATVALEDTLRQVRGAATDRDGFYQIGRLTPGTYVVQVRFIGYAPLVDTLHLAHPLVTLNVQLAPTEGVLGEVVVAAEGGASRVRAGQQTIRPADLQRIPTPDVSGDLASYLQSLPGVVSVGDRGGQLFIRGGTPSQNLVLVDGLLVYQPFHILGFFSAFPEDLVSHVDLYAGGFGARYSGRIGSVIDVATQEGSKERFGAAASFSPLLAGVRVDGPLRRGRVSMLGSVRRSVVERMGPALYGAPLPFHFGDFFFKVHRTDQDNSRCSATVLHTYDRGRIDPDAARDDVFRWNNVVAGGRCVAFPATSSMLLDFSSGLSYVKNAVGVPGDPHAERFSDALQVSSDIHLTSFHGRHRFNWGFFARASWMGYRLGEQFLNVREQTDMFITSGAYVDAELLVGDGLRVNPGLALQVHPYSYPPSLEPRLRMVWQPQGAARGPALSTAFGLYRQTLEGISDERDAGSAFIAWVPAPVQERQARAVHALVGWQQPLGPALRVAAEGYYKRLTDLPVPLWSMIARFTTRLQLARGDVYGVDLRAELRRGPLYVYLGYGYARTTYQAAQENFGVWFGETVQHYHPPHDRRHQANVVVSLERGRFEASARWQFGSGLPYTRPLGFDELIPLHTLPDVRTYYGVTRVLYDKPYQGRLPTYHRLDLSVARTFPFTGGRLTAQAGAINVYDRANLFYYDVFTVRRVDQLPLLPYLSLKLETR